MNWQLGLVLLVGLAASVEDLLRRRISNWTPACALAGGVFYHSSVDGWRGAASSMLAAMAGFAIFLVFYCLGGMGGGDVKLMAGFGALLGSAGRLMEAALWTAAVGGLLALAWLGAARLRFLVRGWIKVRNSGTEEESGNTPESIPYAPAITLGAWLALFAKT